MADRIKNTTIMLMILVALMIVCSGSVGNAVDHSHFTGAGTAVPHLAADQAIIAFYASVDSPTYATPFVPRARSQLFQNDTRNMILKFIEENPGSTMSEISKIGGFNIGTARYHLMILSVNHIIVPYQDGSRHVRYFTNNGAYTKEQMQVMSLLRREPTRKLLSAMAGGDGMSNARISAVSGLSYSEVNRYLKELTAKGIVIKAPLGRGKYLYRLAPGPKEYVVKCKTG